MTTILESVWKTDSVFERCRGLLGRPSPAAGEGMLIAPCASIHTFFMRFPIDALFLNHQGTILKVCPSLQPFRMALCPGAAAVLEIRAWFAQSSGLNVGDQLHWEARS